MTRKLDCVRGRRGMYVYQNHQNETKNRTVTLIFRLQLFRESLRVSDVFIFHFLFLLFRIVYEISYKSNIVNKLKQI